MHRINFIPLLLALLPGCTPKSIGLGDTDDNGDSGESASDSATSDDPTGGGSGSVDPEVFEGVGGVDLAIGPDGSIVVIGQSDFASDPYVNYWVSGEGFQNDWIARFDAAGAPIWVHETPIARPDQSSFRRAVAVGPDGAIHVVWADYSAAQVEGSRLEKLDPAGQTLWTRPLERPPLGLATTADGRAVVVSEAYVDLARQPMIEVFDPDGAPLWQQIYDRPEYHGLGADETHVKFVAIDDGDGAVVVAGELGEQGSGAQVWLMRADLATGAPLWHQPISEPEGDGRVHDLGVSADGTIFALMSEDRGEVRAYSRAGELLWSFEPTVAMAARTLAVAADGSFALTDGVYPPGNHPLERCEPPQGCPVRTRVERRAADRSLIGSHSDDECKEGVAVAMTPSNGVVVLGQCSKPPFGPFSIGLLRYPQ